MVLDHKGHMRIENLTGPIAYHAEGPCWSESWGGLRFVDALAGDLLTLSSTGVHRLHTEQTSASFVRPRTQGGYVIGTRNGIALAESSFSTPTQVLTLFGQEDIRMNDGGTTPDGKLLVGSMSDDGSPTGHLYQVEADLSHSIVTDQVHCSNGVSFSVSGNHAFYVDTLTSRIDQFDYLDGALSNRRPFVTIDSDLGYPDGLTVDSEGTLWVAIWGAGQIHAYDSTGLLAQVLQLPTSHVSACTFGDDDLSTLYITTSQQQINLEQEPQAGSLFSVRPGVAGLPVVSFAG